MSEILTRLKLDTKNFDANLQKSKKNTSSWKNSSSSAMSGLTSTIMKMGAAFGTVAVATKAFNAVMTSSQAIGDAYAETQEKAKTAVGEFFYAIANGDFSGFNQGLDSMIIKAAEAYKAMDQLGNTMISFNWASSENMANITDAQTGFQKARSDGDKKGMELSLEKWKVAMEKQSKAIASVKETTWDAVSKEITKTSNLKATDISIEDVIKIRDIDTSMSGIRTKIKKQYGALYEEYKKQSTEYKEKYYSEVEIPTYTAGVLSSKTVKKPDQGKQEDLAKKYKDAILYNQLLAKYTDEDLSGIFTKLNQVDLLSRQLSKQQKTFETSKIQDVIGKTTASSKAAKKSIEAGFATLAELQASAKAAQEQLMNASTVAARIAAQNLIAEIESKTIHMTAEISYGQNKSSDSDFASNMAGISTKGDAQPTKLNLPKIPSAIPEDGVQKNTEYAESLQGIASVMGSLSGAVSEGAAGWASWIANLLTAVAAAIPAITSLTVANKVEGETAKTTMIAEGGKSVAATPFVGPILAIAAIATLIAAAASIPSFATGGIVPGTSFSGDKVPAMVNSGEVILNAAQQSNLASKLTNRNSNQNITVGGSFVLRGQDLIASISKNNRIISRT